MRPQLMFLLAWAPNPLEWIQTHNSDNDLEDLFGDLFEYLSNTQLSMHFHLVGQQDATDTTIKTLKAIPKQAQVLVNV